ncbi:MAG: beta/gamma crystallin-related protein [Polymorphobacter sp.]
MSGRFIKLAALALALVVTGAPVTAQNSVNVNINTGGRGGQWGSIDLYSQRNFRGQRVRLTTSVSDLRWYNFSGRTESFRVRGQWRLCNQTNFRGHCTTVRNSRSSLGGTAGGNVRSARFLGS